jgi:rRNA maturation endonuclease Nob1
MKNRVVVKSINELQEGKFYKIADLQSVLKNLGLNFSIFAIRDRETWKCSNYKCGKRHTNAVEVCEKCGSAIRPPLIGSPRTVINSTRKGFGHRRYTKQEIFSIIKLFEERK